ncbi:hypothetical protein CsatB_025031 [Cannabis sativa]
MQGVVLGDGGGGALSRASSASGSISTVSKDDNLVFSSEDSSCPDESELELGLGLSLGSSCSGVKAQQNLRGQYARILTAKDFPSASSSSSPSSLSSSSSSSSSSPSSLSRANVSAGTKRSADSVANGASQVVGWPPIRTYRMNSLVNNHAKSPLNEGFSSIDEENRCMNKVTGKADNGDDKKNGISKENGNNLRSSMFVKVNMDGSPIGRKVDLSAHKSYEALARTLNFCNCLSGKAIEKMRNSQEIKDALGEPIVKGPWYNASLAVAHKRQSVSCTFPVSGPQGTGVLQLKAVRNGEETWFSFLRPRDWDIIIMDALLHVPGNNEKNRTFRVSLSDYFPPPSSTACTECKPPQELDNQDKK